MRPGRADSAYHRLVPDLSSPIDSESDSPASVQAANVGSAVEASVSERPRAGDSVAGAPEAGARPEGESGVTDRIEALEQDIASVDRALSTLEDLHTESKGRGGSEAADRIRAVVNAERFPAEPRLPSGQAT